MRYFRSLVFICLLAILCVVGRAALLTNRILPADRFRGWTIIELDFTDTLLKQIWRQAMPNLPKGADGYTLVAYQAEHVDSEAEATHRVQTIMQKQRFSEYVSKGYTISSVPWFVHDHKGLLFSVNGLDHTAEQLTAHCANIYTYSAVIDNWVVWIEIHEVLTTTDIDQADRLIGKTNGKTLAEDVAGTVIDLWGAHEPTPTTPATPVVPAAPSPAPATQTPTTVTAVPTPPAVTPTVQPPATPTTVTAVPTPPAVTPIAQPPATPATVTAVPTPPAVKPTAQPPATPATVTAVPTPPAVAPAAQPPATPAIVTVVPTTPAVTPATPQPATQATVTVVPTPPAATPAIPTPGTVPPVTTTPAVPPTTPAPLPKILPPDPLAALPRWKTADGHLSLPLPIDWHVTDKAPYAFSGIAGTTMCLYAPDSYTDEKDLAGAVADFIDSQRQISRQNFTSGRFQVDNALGVHVSYINFDHHTFNAYYFGKSGRLWRIDIEQPGENDQLPAAITSVIDHIRVE